MAKKNRSAVVITTENRGVFFGYPEAKGSKPPAEIVLKDARMCVEWRSTIKGVLGLASVGPSSDCRIGHKVPKLTAYRITAILECTPEAIEKWEAAPWRA